MTKGPKKFIGAPARIIGSNIQKVRLRVGMPARELAERLGMTAGNLSRLENGGAGITGVRIISCLDIFRCKAVELVPADTVYRLMEEIVASNRHASASDPLHQSREGNANQAYGPSQPPADQVADGGYVAQAKARAAQDASRSSELLTSAHTTTDRVIWQEYPTTYNDHFAGAKKLQITGNNLRRIIRDRMGDLTTVLNRGGHIEIILLDPHCSACKYAAIQDSGRGDKETVQLYIETIELSYFSFYELKEGHANGANLTVKKIDYALAFGLDIMEFDDPHEGAIYVRFYPMKTKVDDRPILSLRAGDGYWYDFYKEQFALHWKLAVDWQSENEKKQAVLK